MVKDPVAAIYEIDALMAKLDAHPESLLFARLADMYAKAGRMDHAVQICEQGLSHRADYVSGHMVMARCYYKIGLIDQAKAEYQRVLTMDDAHTGALFHLGEINRQEKDLGQSLICFQKILQHDPSNELARHHMALVQEQMSRRADGPNSDPSDLSDGSTADDPIATSTLAEIYAAQGLLERALQVLRCVQERSPDQLNILSRIQELEQQMMQDGGTYGHNG